MIVILQWFLDTPKPKNDGLTLSTKDNLIFVRHFPGANTDDMEIYIKPVSNMSFSNENL